MRLLMMAGGWTMAPDNDVPTDVFGDHPVLTGTLKALIRAGIGVTGTVLATPGAQRRHVPGIVPIALALLACNILGDQGHHIVLAQNRAIELPDRALAGLTAPWNGGGTRANRGVHPANGTGSPARLGRGIHPPRRGTASTRSHFRLCTYNTYVTVQ